MNRIVTTYCTSCWIPAVVHVVSFIVASSYSPMYTSSNGWIVASNYLYRAEMLAYAIPSESYAVGANPLPGRTSMTPQSPPDGLYYNHDMATLFTSGIGDLPPNGDDSEDKHRDWQHSTFVQRSYKRVNQLFKEIMKHIKESANE